MIILSILISTSTGYVFATTKFKGKEIIWSILLLGLLMPRISMLIPQFMVIKYLHLSGTLTAVVLSTAFTFIRNFTCKKLF